MNEVTELTSSQRSTNADLNHRVVSAKRRNSLLKNNLMEAEREFQILQHRFHDIGVAQLSLAHQFQV